MSVFLLTLFLLPPTFVFAQDYNIPAGNASRNWSGYVAEGGYYTAVSGSWIIPSVTPGNERASDATWVGIGGSRTKDLIQAGTHALVEGGSVIYQAWYEMLPDYAIPVPLAVSAGDSITASITEQSENVWLITITNNTTGRYFQTTVSYRSSHSSAEWVEEMLTDGITGSFRPLDNFGSVRFAGGTATVNGYSRTIAQLGARQVNMVTGTGELLASVSALDQSGAGFTATRQSGQSVATAPLPIEPPSVTSVSPVSTRWYVVTNGSAPQQTAQKPQRPKITVTRKKNSRSYIIRLHGGAFSITVMQN